MVAADERNSTLAIALIRVPFPAPAAPDHPARRISESSGPAGDHAMPSVLHIQLSSPAPNSASIEGILPKIGRSSPL